ncbi:hypothetical protein MTQ20_07560 [Corynebacterium bovis]
MKESFSSGGEVERVKATFEFNKDLHRALKTTAVTEGRTMREILEELVTEYLQKR